MSVDGLLRSCETASSDATWPHKTADVRRSCAGEAGSWGKNAHKLISWDDGRRKRDPGL